MSQIDDVAQRLMTSAKVNDVARRLQPSVASSDIAVERQMLHVEFRAGSSYS